MLNNAPRVTPEMIDAAIQLVQYTVLQDGRSTICLLTLDNGFTVRGESSCVSRENFEEGVGQHYAFEDARKKLWPLLAFRLADQLAAERIRVELQAPPHANQTTKNFVANLNKALAQAELPSPAELQLPIDIAAATGPAIASHTFSCRGFHKEA